MNSDALNFLWKAQLSLKMTHKDRKRHHTQLCLCRMYYCFFFLYKTCYVTSLEITGTTTMVLVSRGACLKTPQKKKGVRSKKKCCCKARQRQWRQVKATMTTARVFAGSVWCKSGKRSSVSCSFPFHSLLIPLHLVKVKWEHFHFTFDPPPQKKSR